MPAAASSIDALIAAQRRRLDSGDFILLGQIDLIHTALGTLDFRKTGPLLAGHADRSDLMIATVVPPLPPIRKLLNEPCPECAAPCEQCVGAKQANCYVCGGAGNVALTVNCECTADGARARNECPDCRGIGRKAVRSICGGCRGTGKVECPNCFATGLTGRGCESCQHQGRKIELEAQPIERFVHGKVEGRLAVGPIRSIVFHPLDGSGHFEIVDFRPDRDQNLAVMLLEFQPGDAGEVARGYLAGGLPVLRTRSRSR